MGASEGRVMRRVRAAIDEPTVTGAVFGVVGVLLVVAGNPANTGLCASCFLENVAGALGLHGDARMAYLRPELTGIVLGAFLSARLGGEFRGGRHGAAGARFLGGAFMILGASVFLGCPLKVFYRLGAGDATALAGLAGLVAGVAIATRYLRAGFELPHGARASTDAATALVALALVATVLVAVAPALVVSSSRGPGAQHAPWAISLAAGVLLGALGQRSRFCTTGAIRDALLMRRARSAGAPAAMLATVAATSVLVGDFSPGYLAQPSSHLDHAASFVGMALVGAVAVGLGGCPYRQLVLAGQGDSGAVTVSLGMIAGAALVRNAGLASTVEGATESGITALLLAVALVLLFAGRQIARPVTATAPPVSGAVHAS